MPTSFVERLLAAVSDLVTSKSRERDAAVLARVAEEKRLRLARLAANPLLRKYVERIERGERWNDDDIEFNDNREVRRTCVHLWPTEGAMKTSGIYLKPDRPLRVLADCRVNPEALQGAFALPECVRYIEPHIMDRSHLDPRSAMIFCTECTSIIDAVHADTATDGTPWFPQPPGSTSNTREQ